MHIEYLPIVRLAFKILPSLQHQVNKAASLWCLPTPNPTTHLDFCTFLHFTSIPHYAADRSGTLSWSFINVPKSIHFIVLASVLSARFAFPTKPAVTSAGLPYGELFRWPGVSSSTTTAASCGNSSQGLPFHQRARWEHVRKVLQNAGQRWGGIVWKLYFPLVQIQI